MVGWLLFFREVGVGFGDFCDFGYFGYFWIILCLLELWVEGIGGLDRLDLFKVVDTGFFEPIKLLKQLIHFIGIHFSWYLNRHSEHLIPQFSFIFTLHTKQTSPYVICFDLKFCIDFGICTIKLLIAFSCRLIFFFNDFRYFFVIGHYREVISVLRSAYKSAISLSSFYWEFGGMESRVFEGVGSYSEEDGIEIMEISRFLLFINNH